MKSFRELASRITMGVLGCSIAVPLYAAPALWNRYVFAGDVEVPQLVFTADCDLPQDANDGYVVPLRERSVLLQVDVKTVTRDGGTFDSSDIIEVFAGGSYFYEPETEPQDKERAITISVSHVEYRGYCDILVTGRLAGPDRETRATIGDGKIFVADVARAVRINTGDE